MILILIFLGAVQPAIEWKTLEPGLELAVIAAPFYLAPSGLKSKTLVVDEVGEFAAFGGFGFLGGAADGDQFQESHVFG